MKMSPDILRDFRHFMAEADALDTALEAIENPARIREAREALKALPRGESGNLPEMIVRRAIAKLLGEPFHEGVPTLHWEGVSWEGACYEAGLLAWLSWADGEVDDAARRIQTVRDSQRSLEACDGRPGAIHLLSLYLWLGAIDRLAHGDREEAKRLWRRAMDVGSQYGTESHPAIRWTYAASFLPPV